MIQHPNASNRRTFLSKSIAGGVGATAVAFGQQQTGAAEKPAASHSRPKILFLDVNETLLDLGPLKKSVGAALDGKEDLLPLWFTTMLQYSLVNTVADRYEHFTTIGSAALQMVAKNNGIDLTRQQASAAIEPIGSLSPHPDVRPAMEALKEAGFKIVTLTNSSISGVEQQMINSGLQPYLSDRLSVESVGYFKPHPHVYRWAARRMQHEIGDCMLVAAHGWDIAGALWAGMRATFLSRPGKQLYPLAPSPEIVAPDFKKAADRLIDLPE